MSEEVPRKLTVHSTLDNLKKEAKRWLRALRANDQDALARFRRANPHPPEQPTLRDVQLALAREHGLAGWIDLKQRLTSTAAVGTGAQLAGWFLEQVCPDWRTGGPAAQLAAGNSAHRLLDRHPEIARYSLYTAVVCGELAEVRRTLDETPSAASEPGGVKAWQPLHYLCFARLLPNGRNQNAVEMAKLLLDRGADPNASFQIGDARHTALVGVIGQGEESRSPHVHAEELVHLLLNGGASPCDTQVVYNVTQGEIDDPCRWPKLLYEHSVKLGREADWTDAERSTGIGHLSPFDWLLSDAVDRDHRECAQWLLERRASPNARRSWFPQSLYEQAVHRGFTDMAALLVRFGAAAGTVELTAEEAFVAACLRLDRDAVKDAIQAHPEYLESPAAIFTAARKDRPDVVEMLLDLGVPVDIEDARKQHPLHVAAGENALHVAQLLIDRGAEIDPVESNWGATPLGIANYGQKREMIDLLSRHTHDVFELCALGKIERLRQLLNAQPELANARLGNGRTPMMYIQDERRALDVIDVLLSHGAQPDAKLKDGTTVVDLLRRRGLDEAVNALEWILRRETVEASHAARVSSFLRGACLDWRIGGPDRPREMNAAARLLARHPEIARDSIYTAAVCGDLGYVEHFLAGDPDAATEPGGPRGWPPILYVASARLPLPAAGDNALAIARALLDAGGDPNSYYHGGNPTIHYTALTCALGRGEEQGTMHPQAQAFADLLLERGAEPYDIQVFYNVFAGHASQRHLGDEAIWVMELIYRHSIARGRQADWLDPNWEKVGMGARYLLSCAINANHVPLVEWLLAHGANPHAPPPAGRKKRQNTLYEEAIRQGRTDIAVLLLRYGATPPAAMNDEDLYINAILQLDRARAKQIVEAHPELLHSHRALFVASELDRADAVELLLDLGTPVDVEEPQGHVRAVHTAAYHDSPHAARALIDRGADFDFMDHAWGGSALGAASWGGKPRMVELLAPISRDVWSLTSEGKIDRLRELFTAEPRRARVTWENQTPLFWLPDDEKTAPDIVRLFLEHGADATLRNAEGETAADRAVHRGLDEAAVLLRAKSE